MRGENYHALHGMFESVDAIRRVQNEYGAAPLSPDNPWFGAHEVNPNLYSASLAEAFVNHVLSPPQSAHVVGFKEIRVFRHFDLAPRLFDFVLTAFAPARIVFLQRDWEAVSRSSWWAALDRDDVRAYVTNCNSIMERYARWHPTDSIIVHYEQLCSDRATIHELLRFLGEQYVAERTERILATQLKHGKAARTRALTSIGNLSDVTTLVEATNAPERALDRWARRVRRG